jgi:hypothetical protein
MNKNNWDIAAIWNGALERKERKLEPRQRIYASELGGSMIDRYHKMIGTEYTNPPNSRSMRKFMAGDIWEWILKTVLVKAGIPFTVQEKIAVQYDNAFPISGKIDFIAGGVISSKEALERLEEEDVPDFIKNSARAIIEHFSYEYSDGLPKRILEIKSVGSFVFEGLLETGKPNPHHVAQAFCYSKATGIPADIVYVCRDDVRLLQFKVDEQPNVEEYITKDVQEITKYVQNGIEPPKEKLIIWNEDTQKFRTNWKVQYSCYLSKFYTYIADDGKEKKIEQPDEYYDVFQPKVTAWNRVVARMKEGKELTDSNKKYIDEIKNYGFDLETLIKKQNDNQSN